MEATCIGKPVIALDDGSDFKFSPLRDVSAAYFVRNPKDFATIVNQFNSKNFKKYEKKNYFYLNAELKLWKKVFSKMGLSATDVNNEKRSGDILRLDGG